MVVHVIPCRMRHLASCWIPARGQEEAVRTVSIYLFVNSSMLESASHVVVVGRVCVRSNCHANGRCTERMLAWNWMNTHTGREWRKEAPVLIRRPTDAGKQSLLSAVTPRLRFWMSWAGSYYFFACMHDSSSVWSTLHYDESMTWVEWRDGAHASWAVCSVQGREHAVCFWRLYSTCNSSAGREGRRGATCRRYSNNKLACQVTHYCSCRVQYVHFTYWDLGMGCWCSST